MINTSEDITALMGAANFERARQLLGLARVESGVAFVRAAPEGNDTTGTVGRRDLPFATLQAAMTTIGASNAHSYLFDLGFGTYNLNAFDGMILNVVGRSCGLTILNIGGSPASDQDGPGISVNARGLTMLINVNGGSAGSVGSSGGSAIVRGADIDVSFDSAAGGGSDLSSYYAGDLTAYFARITHFSGRNLRISQCDTSAADMSFFSGGSLINS